MKITVVSGTVREGRYSHHVAKLIHQILTERGVDVQLVDVKEFNLPLLDYTFPTHPNPSEKLISLQKIFEQTDGFILVSPEYNGGPCAALKNTLDYFKKEYGQKVMAISTVSAGALGGMRAATTLQQMVLWYGSYPVPQMLTVPNVKDTFSEKGELTNSDFPTSVNRFLDSFIWLTEAVYTKRKNA